MFKRLDNSRRFGKLLENLSAALAKQRGLPIVIGIALIIISFVISLINFVALSPALDIAWSITHHLGLIIALIGIILVEPLGQ